MTEPQVVGLGLWSPGLRSPEAWLRGAADPDAAEPICPLLPRNMARRTSLMTRMVFDVISQAAGTAALASTCVVLGTTRGELRTQLALLQSLATAAEISPARFHNSVYNTALGYLSIATSNRGFTTTIDAGSDSAAMALLEGLALMGEGADDVIVVLADEAPDSPFLPGRGASLAIALRLSRSPGEQPAYGRLANLRRGQAPALIALPEAFVHNPASAALPLVQALLLRQGGSVPLSPPGPDGWLLDVHAPAGAA